MAKASKHPGDDGDWCQGGPTRLTIPQRMATSIDVVSPAVLAKMREEEAFLASIPNADAAPKRFTDRRPPVDRSKLIP